MSSGKTYRVIRNVSAPQYYFWFFVSLLFSLISFYGKAQIGNEWIQYNQQYWKFKVSADGLYRVDQGTLQSAGFPVALINPQFIQVYGRGVQQKIAVTGEADGTFDPGDYIEIYAYRNDGWLDSLVYDSPNHVANPYYSLFNDTAMYFITVGDEPGLRTAYFDQQNFDEYQPLPYCIRKSVNWQNDIYLMGNQDQSGIGQPYYEEGEGWFDTRFSKGQTVSQQLPSKNAYTGPGAPDAVVHTIFAGASLATGFPNHHVQVTWGSGFNIAVDTSFYGFQLNKIGFSIPSSSLGTLNTQISHRSIDDLGVATDFNAVSVIELDYPHTFNFDSQQLFSFHINNVFEQGEGYIEMTNVAGSGHRLFILQNDVRTEIALVNDNDTLKALVPFEINDYGADLLLIPAGSFQSVGDVTPVTQTGYFTNYTENELDSAFVIVTHSSLLNEATNYKVYRQSSGYEVLLADVDELYMQYTAGIWKNPIAIRRFCDDLLQNWSTRPSHLFILGKSIHEMNISATVGARKDAEKYADNLVPTWGYPGSDIVFTSGLDGTLLEPAIPTGRLAAQNADHVLMYLNKVVELENQPPATWQKNVLHFGGGSIETEQAIFVNYLNNYKSMIEDTSFGGQVYTFLKSTTDAWQINLADSVQLLIDQGVSLMTFFGHASSSGFDQNIDSPLNYNNQGKYPLLVGNSCYTGNIHLADATSTSESFVLVPDRGVIGFIAKPDLANTFYLNMWTENFFREMFQASYGKSIGQCMVEGIKDFQVENDPMRTNVILTMTLHGDPAVHLYSWTKPDYEIEAEEIFFEPAEVTGQQENFQVNVVVDNIGKAMNVPVSIELIRHYPNGIDSTYAIEIPELLNRDTVSFALPVDRFTGIGQNSFDVFVDLPVNFISELDDFGNNVVQGKPLLITSGDLIPVYPYQFGIIPNDDPELKASTGYAFEEEKTYLLQLDTTDTFDSPFLVSTSISQSGGVVKWNPGVTLTEGRVYYWRCSPDSIDAENPFVWRESSFEYIQGETGWSQAHFFQFEDDPLTRLEYDRDNREFDFSTTDVTLKCDVYGDPATSQEVLGTRYQLDLDIQDYSGCGVAPALMVAVIDSVSLQPWETNYNNAFPENDFGNLMDCSESRGRTEKYFIFRQSVQSELEGFADMIENHIPDGDFLLIYTWQFADYDSWENVAPGTFDIFSSLGAQQIGLAQDSVPFIFFLKMGHPETMVELYGDAIDDDLFLNVELNGVLGLGRIASTLIGPTSGWENATWENQTSGDLAGDTTTFRLFGVNNLGVETQLGEWMLEDNGISDLEQLAQSASYLRLEAQVKDFTNQTPPQLSAWRVFHEPVPECALNPALGFYLSKDTLDEGESLLFAIAIENISPWEMDSLLVNYWVEDAEHHLHSLNYERQLALGSGEIFFDTISVSTFGLKGNNLLWIDVNPLNEITGAYDQPEEEHFNNIAQLPFFVEADHTNPILDVTFDGQRILNRDIVSADPHIVIMLDDENEYFILDEESDTSSFRIYLTTPAEYQVPVYFSSPKLEWTPATAPKNKFRIDFKPGVLNDGVYTLFVQAKDKSGNESGNFDYRIDFEVISKPTITEVLNYPNPFSTSTRFAFTLTGSEVPDEVKIQIMTIGGTIVREITQGELGTLHIGRNLTEYAWDGRDEFGDQLANGVYLYRVSARLNGTDIELRSTAASEYFNRGFGKMYLMR